MKKITLIVLNNFQNDSRVLKEAHSLFKAGYKVMVAALHEKALPEYETIKNIPVHRIRLKSRGWSKNKLIQILKYLEYIYKAVKRYKKNDIFHCCDLNALPIGVIIKKIFNKKARLVYDAHEHETERAGLKGIEKIICKIVEKLLIKYADAVITVSESIAAAYADLYHIKKPALILNTPLYQKTPVHSNIFRKTFAIKKKQPIFLYQGGLSKGRGIEMMLHTFQALHLPSEPAQLEHYPVIVFMGYGPLTPLISSASRKYNNIYLHQAVKPDVLVEYTASADFGLSIIEDSCLSYRYCLPNKIFEYIMAEIPVIASNLYEMKKLVEANNVGITIKENSPKELQNAVEKAVKLNKNAFQAGIKQLKTVYNWEQQENKLLKTYDQLYEN
ncbi:MAG TPA: glycosyltransferase [Spirochaetota bacterium]|nr:glycosyltransferase [Spirochaetota bacterium]